LKFLCIRTYWLGSAIVPTPYRWKKGEYYEGREPNELEKSAGIAYFIKSDERSKGEPIEHFVKKKDYTIYFKSIEDIRDEKLEELLSNK
jgi:hypothetical protein